MNPGYLLVLISMLLASTGCDGFSTNSSSSAYAVCSDDALNSSQCSTSAERYVTATAGTNVSASNGSLTVTIPQGFYDGSQICTASDSGLTAANVRSGTTVFGIAGTYVGSYKANMASTMYRDPGTTQISLLTESETNAAAAYSNSFTGYRAIPDITTDDDGRLGGPVPVDRTAGSATGLWAARTCGLAGTIDARIASCVTEFGADATWNGAVKGHSGQGTWKLVTRTGTMSGSKGREVWQDQRTGLLWSSRVALDINWCKASGSNNITNNPTAQDDPSDLCDNATYQTVGTGPGDQAISACFEEAVYFTSTDADIDVLGKGGLNRTSTPAVSWRLPTRDDFFVAVVNGMQLVLPDADTNFGYWEWTATVESGNRSRAWMFSTWDGAVSAQGRDNDAHVRCVGR